MSRKKKGSKKDQKSYGEKIAACVGKSWKSTGDIIKAVKCPARAARRVLRGLVKQRVLKSVKVQRERYFAQPGTKSAPPKAEAPGNGRTRSRSRKAKSSKASKGGKASGKKSKRRRAGRDAAVQSRKNSRRANAASGGRSGSAKSVTRARKSSGPGGTPASAPDSVAEIQQAAEKTLGAEAALLS
jgi:hypothetical protein